MTTYGKYWTIPGVVAASDLSANQYYVVSFASTAGEVKLTDAAVDTEIAGILQNEPEAGEPAEVACLGIAKGITESTACTYGLPVSSNSTGELQKTQTDEDRVLGIALQTSSAAGDIIDVLISPSWFGTT